MKCVRRFNYIVWLNLPFSPELTPDNPPNVATRQRPHLRGLLGRLSGTDSAECNTTTRTAKKPREAALPIVDPVHFIMHGAMS